MSATHDLRSEARDSSRVKTHNAKWSRGARPAQGLIGVHNRHEGIISRDACDDCNVRPNRELSRNYTSLRQMWTDKATAQTNTMARKAFRGSLAEAIEDAQDDLSDSSGDHDIDEASAAPELNEVMFSFDAATGPSRGGNVLSYAVTQAVQRYENNETDKIVKKEYDLVLDGRDEPESLVVDADDDFELIDASHFK